MRVIERRPTLQRAKVSDDVVGELLATPAAALAAATAPAPAPTARKPRASRGATSQPRAAVAPPALEVVPAPAVAPHRGPGRPRGRRRMEPFSSKMEIGLRDQVDAYLGESGESIVDLLDRALRAAIANPLQEES